MGSPFILVWKSFKITFNRSSIFFANNIDVLLSSLWSDVRFDTYVNILNYIFSLINWFWLYFRLPKWNNQNNQWFCPFDTRYYTIIAGSLSQATSNNHSHCTFIYCTFWLYLIISWNRYRSNPDIVDNVTAVLYAVTTNESVNVLLRVLAYNSLTEISLFVNKVTEYIFNLFTPLGWTWNSSDLRTCPPLLSYSL